MTTTTTKPTLQAVFAALRKAGVYARCSYACCGSCGHYAATQHIAAVRTGTSQYSPHKYHGYVFYTQQDNPRADGGVYLKFGSVTPTGALYVGQQVRNALVAAGYTVEWNGQADTCLWVVL